MVDINRSIFWHQGLFLQPHHFQQHDLYIQDLQQPLRKFLNPYFWGVAAMEASRGALDNFSFDLLKGEFVFQDGTQQVMKTIEARRMAEDRNLDLIEVQPNAEPPVCKLDNLGKLPDEDYYVCSVCGYTSEKEPPDKCPVCGAAKKAFS